MEDWKDYIIRFIPLGCIKRFDRNKLLILNLVEIFTYLGETFKILFNLNNYIHLFINKSLPEVNILIPNISIYENSLKKDINQQIPCYVRRRLSQDNYRLLNDVYKVEGRIKEREDLPIISSLQSSALDHLFRSIGFKLNIPADEIGRLVPFDFSGINLGLFILWEKRVNKREIESLENERLRGGIASSYFFLKGFLEREYSIASEDTYLPSFYAARRARVAILYADIENFPLINEKLDNYIQQELKEPKDILHDILNRHCEEMAKIIQYKGWGRIDRFFGAGVLAIFGEYEDNPCKAVCCAVYAASRMVKFFREFKRELLQMVLGENYEIEYNEPLDIEFAIGVDYGTVLFDFLGDENHRDYTVIGDHVNFAKWLERESIRVDDKGEGCRQHILLSSTVERCVRQWIRGNALQKYEIRMTEKSCTYTVYGLDPEDFNENKFNNSIETQDWKFF